MPPISVLLLDDNRFNREGLRLYLQREEVVVLETGDEQAAPISGSLPFFLEVSRSLAYDDPAKAVRQIRANLAPFHLQTSFVLRVRD